MGRIVITLQILGLLGMLAGGYMISHLDASSQHVTNQVVITGTVG